MQTTLIDPADLFCLVHFFDILAAVVFAVSGALVASRWKNERKDPAGEDPDVGIHPQRWRGRE